jgi:CubicO group peptidase (beta-lactamase class C family)
MQRRMAIRTTVIIWLATVVLLATGCGVDGADVATRARVDSLLERYTGRDVPGACLMALADGGILYRDCRGMADLERGEPTGPATNFRLASLTKQFTAMAIMLLVEDGHLGYDATLTEILPGFPEYGDAITVRHLLTHTSGLIDYENLIPDSQITQVKDRDVLRMMRQQDSTYFPPGSEHRYSNTGYALLAMVVEHVAAQSFAGFLSQRIFEPLGMEQTVAFEEGISAVASRAYGYSRTDSGWTRTDQSVTSAVLGDGGVYTSLDDLRRWIRMLDGEARPVSDQALAAAFEPMVLTGGDTSEYGLGWFVDEHRGRLRFRHGGSTRGFRNAIQRFPDEGLTVVFLSNRNQVDEGYVDSIVDTFLADAR